MRGQWTFESGSELADLTGNFPPLELQGNATVSNGALDLNGAGTTSTGWAHSGIGGTAITNKTLVSWITLQSLSDVANSGAAITLQTPTLETTGKFFDGIVFAEQYSNRWMNGSHMGWRSPLGQFDQAAAVESTTGSMIMLAITYQDLGGGNVRITGYRNGVQMGTYDSAHIASWAANDQVVVFGPRTLTDGALDALVHEARLYDKTCSAAEIQALNTAGPLATSAFNTWVGTAAGGRGLSGAAAAFDADPDGDGIPNGIEFVIGGEPNPANPGANSCGLLPAASNLGTDFVFTYLLSNEAASLNPLVEFDTDLLGEWTTAVDGVNATIVVTPGDPAATVTVTIPQGAKRELFARLKVTQP